MRLTSRSMREAARAILVFLIMLIFSCAPQNTFAKTKIKKGYYALVIGNSKYTDQSVSTLRNAVNDAQAIRNALQRLGFTVIYGKNLTYDGMRDITRKFFKEASDMDVGLLFYSGHGIQIKSQNFLIPVDANFSSNRSFHHSVISISKLVEHLDNNSKSGIIFLDACRDNPFRKKVRRSAQRGILKMTRSIGQILRKNRSQMREYSMQQDIRGFYPERTKDSGDSSIADKKDTASQVDTVSVIDVADLGKGLAKIDAGDEMFISFATRPGETALDGRKMHSPFTAGLLKFIERRDLLITQVSARVAGHVKKLTGGKQVPWTTFSLTTDLRLASLPGPNQIIKRPKTGGVSNSRRRSKKVKTARSKKVKTRRNITRKTQKTRRLDSPTIGIGGGAGGL